MTSRWLVALCAMASLALPATAQQGIAILSAEAGIGNWVAGNAPMTIHVTVEAALLVSGTVEVLYGGAATHIPVDVPAGGAKTYEIPIRSAFRNGSVRVNLLDDDGDRIATQTVRPEVATDEIVVGVVADPATEATLSSLESTVDGLPIVPVDTPADVSIDEAHALSYLVSADPTPDQWEWVAEGGRLITGPAALTAGTVELESLHRVPGTEVEWYGMVGGGEVFALDTIAGAQDWRAVLRPAPLDLVPNDQWGTPESSLLRSATGSGEGGLASLPWLPFGMLAYLIVIGPVNMLVLKRIGRREWAWVSIPALAFLAVGVFWVAGRQRLETTTARHATVTVAGDRPYQRSVFVLAAGKEGEYSIEVDGADAYAVADVSSAWGGTVGTTAPGTVDALGVSWELPQLGVGAVETWSTPAGTLAAAPSDDGRSISVTNDTGSGIDHWGAVANGSVYVATGSLGPGETGTLSLDNRFGGWPGASLGDAVVEIKQLWDSSGWEVVAPLGYVAQTEAGPTSFAFGIVESAALDAAINGEPRTVDGPTIWVAPLDDEDGFRTASGTVIGVGDWRNIEVGQGSLWLDTDHLLLRFLADPAAPSIVVEVEPGFGGVGPIEAWNWRTSAFDPVTRDEPIEAASYMAPNGEVIVRQAAVEQTGEPPYPQALTVVWDEAT